jgi:hypothetical protein
MIRFFVQKLSAEQNVWIIAIASWLESVVFRLPIRCEAACILRRAVLLFWDCDTNLVSRFVSQ